MKAGDKRRWLDDPANVTLLYRLLWAAGLATVALDLFVSRHDDVGFAEWLGYYAAYGFAGVVLLVLAAKGLRRLVARAEDYYDGR
jgi:hypothetical protein